MTAIDNLNLNQNDPQMDIETKWETIKNAYRSSYPSLTEEDTSYREGEFDDMTHRVGRRTNRTREQVVEEIENWVNS